MARARNIKPGFFKNEELAELSAIHRLLFVGLWTLADRNGVLEDRPRKIKLELLPYDTFDAEQVLGDLESKGFILRYKVEQLTLIHITNFSKHQNPHHTEKSSGLPIPPEVHGEVTVKPPLRHGENLADSLIPDSLIPGFTDSASSAAQTEPPPVRAVLESAKNLRTFPSAPQYSLDETYQPIIAVAREFWPDSISEDFATAHFNWKTLDWEQKLEATANLRAKQAAEPGRGCFVKKNFAAYLASDEWKRPARDPPKTDTKSAYQQQREQISKNNNPRLNPGG